MNIDDLKNIDINDIAGWPLPIKIVGTAIIAVAIVFAGYWFIISGELEEHEEAKRKEIQLRETYVNKKALAINLDAYKRQMKEMEQTFGSLLRQLPNTTEIPDLLIDITQSGLGRGLEFELFKPEGEVRKDFYAELPISIRVKGSYNELALFVSDVAGLPRIVTFGDISISSRGKSNKLVMSAKARTYRYLDAGGGR